MAEVNVRAVINAITTDPKAQELLKDIPQPEDEEAAIRVYADIAAQLGYEITEEDLKDYMEKAAALTADKTETAASQIQELPDDVLDKVAGGKKEHDQCKDTYQNRENCWVNDGCDNIFNSYNDYLCHYLFWDDPCHATAKHCNKDEFCLQGYSMSIS